MLRGPAWGRTRLLAGGLLAALLLGLGLACLLAGGLAWYTRSRPAQAAPPALPALDPASGMLVTPQPGAAVTPVGGAAQQSSGGLRYAEIGGVPLPEGVRVEAVVGDERSFSVITQLPYDRVVAFYQLAMPEWGWTRSDRGERLTPQTSQLHFTQEARSVQVTITRAPFVGTVIAVEFS